jgi:hypothetical protein
MKCGRCGSKMLELFYSCVCEHCENGPQGRYHRAYAVIHRTRFPQEQVYLFRTSHDAVIWRSLCHDDTLELVTVLMRDQPQWRCASGRAAGLVWADTLYDVYPDHRHQHSDRTAFIAPQNMSGINLVS